MNDEMFSKLIQLRLKNEAELAVIFSVSPRTRAALLVNSILNQNTTELAEADVKNIVTTGPKLDASHDHFLVYTDGRWAIKGTHKKTGDEFSYADKVKARHFARRAYPEGKPRYKAGERLWYSADGKTRESITLGKDMTFVCSIGYTKNGDVIQARKILGPVYQEKEGEG